MTNASTVLAVAAVVWDQSSHSEADLEFLYAVNAASKEYLDTVNDANIKWGGGSKAWEAIKNLATRSRDEAYGRALAALETHDETAFLEAAE